MVARFMDERVNGSAAGASQFLDPVARQAFQSGASRLTITDEPKLRRYFVVTAQSVPGSTQLRYVLRLVLARDGVDQSQFDEVLTLQPAPDGSLLVHGVTAGPTFPVDDGPQVLSVSVAAGEVKVTFDADLDAASLNNGVTVTDRDGNNVPIQVSYADRVVTLKLTNSTPATFYKLTVDKDLKDIAGNSIPSEYSLEFVTPAA
jgi:hypothetical protein